MKTSRGLQAPKSIKTRASASKLTCDVKTLVRVALDRNQSDQFCSKTTALGKFLNSRHKRLKTELDETISDKDFSSFVEELYDARTYLHPVVSRRLARHLKTGVGVTPEIRRKVY